MGADELLTRATTSRILSAVLSSTAISLATGCATGIRSTPLEPNVPAPAGLVYFLPGRDVTVTIVVAENRQHEITVAAAEARPDPTAGFVATIPRNDAGTVDSTLVVNERGLLDSDSTTSVTSSLTDILSKLGSLAGMTTGRSMTAEATEECPGPGTYRRSFSVPFPGDGEADQLCGYTVTIAEALDPAQKPRDAANAKVQKQQGLFYRVPIPYKVTLQNRDVKREFVVYSPTGSPTYFLPLEPSTFATNTATLGFKDGVPVKYKQAIGNEAVGLLSIPASVLESYFSAVGSMFTGRKGISEKEVAYLNQLNAAAEAEARRVVCAKVAEESRDIDEIRKACAK